MPAPGRPGSSTTQTRCAGHWCTMAALAPSGCVGAGTLQNKGAWRSWWGKLAANPGITELVFGSWGNTPGLATGHRCGPVKALVKALRAHPRVRLHLVD